MNSAAVPDQTPMIPLFRRAMTKTRKPGNRNRNRTSVGQINGQRVVSKVNVFASRYLCFNR